jgi:hypothetical protein
MLCSTTAPGDFKDYENLPISVTVEGQGTAFATKTFSYRISQTPYLNFVYPSVSYGGSGTLLYWDGYHRITDLGEDKMLGIAFILFQVIFMDFILVKVFVQDLVFTKMLLVPILKILFNVTSRLDKKPENIY